MYEHRPVTHKLDLSDIYTTSVPSQSKRGRTPRFRTSKWYSMCDLSGTKKVCGRAEDCLLGVNETVGDETRTENLFSGTQFLK